MLDISKQENANRTKFPKRHTGTGSDDLALDAILDLRAHVLKALACNRDRPELGHIDGAVAIDAQQETAVFIAEQLDMQGIAGTENIVAGHRNIARRCKCCRSVTEQIVAEWTQHARIHFGAVFALLHLPALFAALPALIGGLRPLSTASAGAARVVAALGKRIVGARVRVAVVGAVIQTIVVGAAIGILGRRVVARRIAVTAGLLTLQLLEQSLSLIRG